MESDAINAFGSNYSEVCVVFGRARPPLKDEAVRLFENLELVDFDARSLVFANRRGIIILLYLPAVEQESSYELIYQGHHVSVSFFREKNAFSEEAISF